MPKTYEELDIEIAKEYYLGSLTGSDLFYVGDYSHFNALKTVLPAELIVATTGKDVERCTLLLATNDEECKKIIERMREIYIFFKVPNDEENIS
jgi:hypothetical protein